MQRLQAPRDPLIGQVIAERYRVDELLGVGGMGCVYRGLHIRMQKAVALKVLHRRMNFVPEAVARFEREAIAAARVQHENVAAAHDFGCLPDGTLYMVLEFVEGKSLRDVIREGVMPGPRAVEIVCQIAEALSAAHAEGVVHRDLKPENVMLTGAAGRELVKVLDFGIAKLSMEDPEAETGAGQLTQLGSVFGTPDYMSPEQAAGKPVDHRADLYALGVVFYELLTGAPPFTGPAIAVVLAKQLDQPPPPLPPAVDARVAEFVMRLLDKDPEARPSTADGLVEQLRALHLSLPPPPTFALKPLPPAGGKLAQRGRELLGQLRGEATVGWERVRRRLEPPLTSLWRRAVARILQLELVVRPVSIGKARLPVWGLCAIAALALGLALLLVSVAKQVPEAERRPLPGPRSSAPRVAVVPETSEPRRLSDERFQSLLSVPAYKRKLEDWLMLGDGHLERKEWSEATAAYRNAVQLDRAATRNAALLGGLRTVAEQHESYKVAIGVADNLLGDVGMDLLYDLWVGTQDDPRKRAIADLAQKKLKIHHLRKGSRALRVRLGLEFVEQKRCKRLAKLVEEAIAVADQRSLASLGALRGKTGCGAAGRQDCYPCLRETQDLDAALQAAARRPAPVFEGGTYRPAP